MQNLLISVSNFTRRIKGDGDVAEPFLTWTLDGCDWSVPWILNFSLSERASSAHFTGA
jgi:hypothetical protein